MSALKNLPGSWAGDPTDTVFFTGCHWGPSCQDSGVPGISLCQRALAQASLVFTCLDNDYKPVCRSLPPKKNPVHGFHGSWDLSTWAGWGPAHHVVCVLLSGHPGNLSYANSSFWTKNGKKVSYTIQTNTSNCFFLLVSVVIFTFICYFSTRSEL
jgi:hypothetical protein